jgi:Rieske Fe-S protein
VPGLEDVVLVDPCYGDTFNAEGEIAFGPSARRLDTFPVTIDNGKVVVELAKRKCAPDGACIKTQ